MRGILHAGARISPIVGASGAPLYPTNPDDILPVFALLGDSITLGCRPTNTGHVNRGYWPWAQALSGFRAYAGVYAGVGGNITTQMLARLEADVITPMAAYAGRDRYCIVMGGVNDSVTDSDIIATATGNLAGIYDALIAAGITPIAMTATPTSSATTTTQIANWNGINGWLRTYCPANGIALCDNIADCLDQSFPATTSPIWKIGYSHDGVHPTALGAQAIARALVEQLELLDPVQHFRTTTDAFFGRILSNHAMTGSSGTLSEGATGMVATAWELFYGAGAKSARTDGGAGEWQKMEITATQVRIGPDPSIDVISGFAPGDLVVAQLEVVCVNDWVNISQFVLLLEFRNGSTVLNGLSFLNNDPYSQIIGNPTPDGTLILRTTPTSIPVGCNIIRTYLNFAGDAGTIKIGRYELLKLAIA